MYTYTGIRYDGHSIERSSVYYKAHKDPNIALYITFKAVDSGCELVEPLGSRLVGLVGLSLDFCINLKIIIHNDNTFVDTWSLWVKIIIVTYVHLAVQ